MFKHTRVRDYRDLLKQVSEEKIYAYTFINVLGVKVPSLKATTSSPLREDKNPSFSFYVDSGRLRWKDHSLSNPLGNNAISLYQHATGKTYREALDSLHKALIVREEKVDEVNIQEMARYREAKATESGVIFRGKGIWEPHELEYWATMGIDKKMLKFFKVFPVVEAWFDHRQWHKATVKDLMFYYHFRTDPWCYQLYRPRSRGKKNKFRSKNMSRCVMGHSQLPKSGEVLFITSSMKDIINLRVSGYPAVARGSEAAAKMMPKVLMDHYKERFKRIISFMDNDKAGLEAEANLLEEYPELEAWHIPEEYPCTDPSDMIVDENLGRKELEYLLKHQLHV